MEIENKSCEKRRIVFSFDEKNINRLEKIQKRNNLNMAEAIRESMMINNALLDQIEEGFGEIIVRNPKTGEEKILVFK